ncbi:PEP-CTERM sorting domain-containing protein [Telluria beijingensis]|uniref:PEP-CTERM sorting domain-containing protein n=1 Tax=Telluria beijingensis TaxID=3068633 RepID=UPI0027959C27|nr:PEP-CTERM sorting domain-containing protein [Massilia sp. REN29]
MLRITPLLFAAALLAQPAQAGVKYSWQQVEASASMPANLNLELVFSAEAVSLGELKLDFRNNCYSDSCGFKQDSLLSLRYWYGGADSATGANLIDYRYNRQPTMFYDRIELSLTFLPEGLLGGSMYVSNGESDFRMSSAGSLFAMIEANSDQKDGCGFQYPACAGSTGLLVGVAQNEVPEPSSAALAGLGLAAAWFARRRRSR